MLLRLARVGALGFMLALGAPAFAHADELVTTMPVPDPLMSGLAAHAQKFEEMKARGAFTATGHSERVEDDGKVAEVKDFVIRSTPTKTPHDRITKVTRYTEDGQDKTAEMQDKADARRAKHKEAKNQKAANDFKLPFVASEQSRYIFSVLQHDPANPTRVLIGFKPKVDAEDAFKGTAWVDETDREILSMGFSPSQNPTFIDHVDVTIQFGLVTALGRAPSKLTLDGKGGFLFIHKHYRATVTLSDPALI